MEAKLDQMILYLNQIQKIPNSEKEWLRRNRIIKHIPKNTHILKPGETQKTIGFNCAGIFKYYYLDINGNEKIKYLCDENQFVLSLTSFLDNSPSLFFIQALEDSTLLTFAAEAFETLIKHNLYWQNVFQHILTQTLLTKERREAEFLMLSAEERYQKLCQEKPDLIHRVKQQEIAEYLGINPVHLSRIRSKMKHH